MKTTRYPRRGGRVWGMICFLLLALTVLAAPVSARETVTQNGRVNVSAAVNAKKTDEIVVTVKPDSAFLKAHKDETVYLFVLAPYENENGLAARSPAASAKLRSETELRVTDAGDYRYAKYVTALGADSGYAALGDAVSVSNPDVYAKNTAARGEAPSLKGVTVSQGLLGEAEKLGISYAVIPVVLDEYLIYDYSEYSVRVGETTTFFDASRIAALDHEVETLRGAGVRVLFRFLLDGTARATAMPAADLYAPGADAESSLWGICSATETGYRRACAVFSFFAERYAADKKEAPLDFILGYQVSEGTEWNNFGAVSDKEAVRMYADTFKIADTALRSVSANSRVYVPFSNLFTAMKNFLYVFSAEMDGGAWSVAVAPYASDACLDAVWSDSGASEDADSPYLTVKNLGLLRDLLAEKRYQYHNRLRAVILDDFAVQGIAGDTESEQRQAASLAYAYYRAANAGFIDAVIWHRLYDSPDEGASYGLYDMNGKRKAAYRVFETVDTALGSAETEPLLSLLGEKNWFRGCSVKKAETVKRFEAGTEDRSFTELHKTDLLLDFTDKLLHGFVPTEQAASAAAADIAASGTEINGSVLQVNAYPSADGGAAGATLYFSDGGKLLSGVQYLVLTVKAEPSGGNEQAEFTLLLGQKGETKRLFSGEAVLQAGQWTTLAFDIGDYLHAAGKVDSLKLMTKCGTQGGTFSVNDISAVLGSSENLFVKIFLVIFFVLLALVLIFALLVLRAQIIRRRKRKQRQQQLAARRAAMQNAAEQNAAVRNTAAQNAPARNTAAQNPSARSTAVRNPAPVTQRPAPQRTEHPTAHTAPSAGTAPARRRAVRSVPERTTRTNNGRNDDR